MKFKVKIQSDRQTSEHLLEAAAGPETLGEAGNIDVLLDGEVVRADWALVVSGRYSVLLQEKSYQVRVWRSTTPAHRNSPYVVSVGRRLFHVELQDPRDRQNRFLSPAGNGPEEVLAPMPGKIVRILAGEGDRVLPGQGLLVIEAMKMQNEVRSSRAGSVEKIHVREGEGVEAGSRLLRLA